MRYKDPDGVRGIADFAVLGGKLRLKYFFKHPPIIVDGVRGIADFWLGEILFSCNAIIDVRGIVRTVCLGCFIRPINMIIR